MLTVDTQPSMKCYHCGENCNESHPVYDSHTFCCNGCQTVYEILKENNLCNYYSIEPSAGVSLKNHLVLATKFEFLDEADVKHQLLDFTDGEINKVTFFIPSMHCSSCIWLLEHLYKMDKGITQSRTDFLKKTVMVTFRENETSLRKVVELLSAIGYEPQLSLNDVVHNLKDSQNKTLTLKLAIAGFCAGNIMMFSFPEYFGLDALADGIFTKVFTILNLILSLPVVFYCGWGYVESSYKSLRKGLVNLDVPILLGIWVTFGRSLYEVVSMTGPGYFDSLSGLIFFLLIGKWYQSKTFDYLSFERDFKSFFPLVSLIKKDGREQSVPVMHLKPGDTLIVRNQELVPADAILLRGDAFIDYSFITGESRPVTKLTGETIYAGGRQDGGRIELMVTKETSQSYLTQLWNHHETAKRNHSAIATFTDTVGKYFTYGILILSVLVLSYWLYQGQPDRAFNALTTMLIVACPCALGLSSPVALGNAVRIFGKNKFYLKNANVVENLAKSDTVVFDKTGTITRPHDTKVTFVGAQLKATERQKIKSLASHSNHPLSRQIYSLFETDENLEVQDFEEISSKGVSGEIDGQLVKIGSRSFVDESGILAERSDNYLTTRVYISINEIVLGYFKFSASYRDELDSTLAEIGQDHDLYLLSGDNAGEKEALRSYFKEENLNFNSRPEDKLNFIAALQKEHKKVIMVGDGLNDAGALRQSEVGISVTEDIANFSPACDVIMESSQLSHLPTFIKYSKAVVNVIKFSFIISLTYNMIGLSFAAWGNLSPVVAAILMPASSATMVLFSSVASNWAGKKLSLI
jgi:Cu+-exporting ATPase